MKPVKIETWIEVVPTKGRWKGKPVHTRQLEWEMNGRRYKTRKAAMSAAADEAALDDFNYVGSRHHY